MLTSLLPWLVQPCSHGCVLVDVFSHVSHFCGTPDGYTPIFEYLGYRAKRSHSWRQSESLSIAFANKDFKQISQVPCIFGEDENGAVIAICIVVLKGGARLAQEVERKCWNKRRQVLTHPNQEDKVGWERRNCPNAHDCSPETCFPSFLHALLTQVQGGGLLIDHMLRLSGFEKRHQGLEVVLGRLSGRLRGP